MENYYEAGKMLLCENYENLDDISVRLRKQLDIVAKVPEDWRDELTSKQMLSSVNGLGRLILSNTMRQVLRGHICDKHA